MLKNSFLILLAFTIIAVGCKKEEAITDSILELSVNSLTFEYVGGSQVLSVSSTSPWDVTSELPLWLSHEVKDEETVVFTAVENTNEENRSCRLIFSSVEGESDTLYIKQEAVAKLCFADSCNLRYDSSARKFHVDVEANISFDLNLSCSGDWIRKYSPLGNLAVSGQSQNKIRLEIDENLSEVERVAKVIVCNKEYSLSDTLTVCQKGCDISGEDRPGNEAEKFFDGQYLVVQQSVYRGVDIVFMGDGFTSKDLTRDGRYINALNQAIDYFFSIEPYSSYRDYFNVYQIIAESPSEGIGEKKDYGLSVLKTKFETAFGSGTEIVCNDKLVFEYAKKVKELQSDKPLTVVVVLNSEKYAGTAYLFPDGNSIALCPMSTHEPPGDFEGVVHHEAGGHAFGLLCDEYVYHQREMPSGRKESIRELQKEGFYLNLDFTDDLSRIRWKDFIGLDKYAEVGAYEGGYEYQYGVWRPEENSCMNNNIPYYNVQSRWAIVDRIMNLSGIDYTVDDFIANDNVEPYIGTRSLSDTEFVPLGEPVLMR